MVYTTGTVEEEPHRLFQESRASSRPCDWIERSTGAVVHLFNTLVRLTEQELLFLPWNGVHISVCGDHCDVIHVLICDLPNSVLELTFPSAVEMVTVAL